jgi:uncharacterized protein (DUF2141 family)
MTTIGAGWLPKASNVGKPAWSGLALSALAWLAVALIQPARAEEPAAPTATLVIHIENVGAGGMVRLGLYTAANYPDDKSKPVASADVKAVEGETVITLHDVPPGTYAIETYQDVNCNERMDTTWLGLPLEPYGFSRDAHPVLSKPPFSKVKFALAAGEQSQTLHLQNGVSLLASK